jgi:pheromone a factor receptor
MTIYTFYKRHRQFKEIMSSNPGLNRSRYFRLMAISGVEICFTIPLATFLIVNNARNDVQPWRGWAYTHSDYSTVNQVAGFIWKSDPILHADFELFRWSLVLCSFVFFGLFGFADEARQNYRRVYTTLASRIGYSTFTLQGSSHACVVYPLCSVHLGSMGLIVIWSCSTSSVPYVKSKGGITVSVITSGDSADRRRSSISFDDQPSTIPSISLTTDFKTDLKVEEYSPSDSMTSVSVESFIEPAMMQDQLPDLPAGIQPTFPPASFPPLRAHYAGAEAV